MHTPEGMPLPPNAVAELQRDMARLGFVVGQIREIEEARQKRLEQQPETGPHAMVRLLARIVGVGVQAAPPRQRRASVVSSPCRCRHQVHLFAELDTHNCSVAREPLRGCRFFLQLNPACDILYLIE